MTIFPRLAIALGVLLAITAAWPLGPDARAQGAAKTPVIAVIDYARAIHTSSAGQSLRKQLDKQREVYQKEIKNAESKLQEAQEELKQQQAVLSPEAFARAFRRSCGLSPSRSRPASCSACRRTAAASSTRCAGKGCARSKRCCAESSPRWSRSAGMTSL